MTNDLPKPDDQNGWNERMEAMFGQILGSIPKPVDPKESQPCAK